MRAYFMSVVCPALRSFGLMAVLSMMILPQGAQAADTTTARLMACNAKGGIYEEGRCIPIQQYRSQAQKQQDLRVAKREQERRRICASIKDPCTMPLCQTPTMKCPDALEKVRKMMPPPPPLPRPAIGKPSISNLANGGNTGVNGGLATNPLATIPTSPPPAGIAPPTAVANPMTPVSPDIPLPEDGQESGDVTVPGNGGTGTPSNRLQAVPKDAPVAPEKDKASGGGLPSWLRFGK